MNRPTPLESTLDAAPAGILICDGSGRITLVSSMLLEMFGYAPSELALTGVIAALSSVVSAAPT